MSDFYIESRRYENVAIIRNAVRDQCEFLISGVENSCSFRAVKLAGDFFYLAPCDENAAFDFSFVLITFSGRDAKYSFRTRLTAPVSLALSANKKCYKLKIPDQIVVIQRRHYQRVEVPDRCQYDCYMMVKNGQKRKFLIKNISKGGVALLLHSDNLDFNFSPLTPGGYLKDVHFDFHEGMLFKETLRVVDVLNLDSGEVYAISCEFRNARESTLSFIDEFMTKIMLGMKK